LAEKMNAVSTELYKNAAPGPGAEGAPAGEAKPEVEEAQVVDEKK